jgi:anti-anti-sigma factor
MPSRKDGIGCRPDVENALGSSIYLVKGKMQQRTQVDYSPCSRSSQEMGNELDRLSGSGKAFTLGQPSRTQNSCIVRLGDWLRLPFKGELPHAVRRLLGRGERNIVLDLACVPKIDAAGIGELVRAYNMAMGSNGTLRIANTNPWVREMLERVGLFDRLKAGSNDSQERYRANC